MHCRLGVDDDPWNALERLRRFARVAGRLPKLPRLEPRALRSIIAGMSKDLATVAANLEKLGIPREEWRGVAERCGKLLCEVGRGVAAVENLMALGAPGPHEEALRRLAAVLAEDPCIKKLEELGARATSSRA